MTDPPLKKRSVRAFFRDFRDLTRPFHRHMALVSLAILAMQANVLAETAIINRLVDAGLHPTARPGWQAAGWCGAALGVLLIQSGLQFFKARRTRTTVATLEADIERDLLEKLLRLCGPFMERHNPAELQQTVRKGIQSLTDMSFQFSQELVPLLAMFVATTAGMAWYEPRIILLIVPTMALFGAMTVLGRSKKWAERQRRHRLAQRISKSFGAAVTNARTVAAFTQEEEEVDRLAEQQQGCLALLWDEYRAYDRLDFWQGLCVGLGRIGACVICYFHLRRDPAFIVMVFTVLFLTDRLFRQCYTIGSLYARIVDAAEPLELLLELKNEPVPVVDPPDPVEPREIRGEIRFVDASFAYATTPGRPALDKVNLTIRPGETIGIVGASGGGKSTLVKALLRFIDVQGGAVLLDGVDIRRLRLKRLRQSMSYVLQTGEAFDRSIGDNIKYGSPDATPEEIVAAAKQAKIHDFIVGLPEGYETLVGDRGLRLSGGELQRIALARAFLKSQRAPIIILDEATASVDVHNDAGIHLSVQDVAASGKTVIVIAHRLATVKNADRIVCLDHGRIVEVGTPAELAAKRNGYYANLRRAHEAFDKQLIARSA